MTNFEKKAEIVSDWLCVSTADAIRNYRDEIDDCELLEDVNNIEQLVNYLTDQNIYDADEDGDPLDFAEWWIREHGGEFTKYGYIERYFAGAND